MLFALSIINLFTKRVATLSGGGLYHCLLRDFHRFGKSHPLAPGAHTRNLTNSILSPVKNLTPKAVGVRKDNILVLVRDYHTLYQLAAVLRRVNTARQDVVVLHIRILQRAASGESELVPEQLFSCDGTVSLYPRPFAGGKRRQEHSLVGGFCRGDLGRHPALRPVSAILDHCPGILRDHGGARGSAIMRVWRGKNCLTRSPNSHWKSILPMGRKKSSTSGPTPPT